MTDVAAVGTAQQVTAADVTAMVDSVARLLRARGERMTGPRRAVLAVLAAQSEHVGAEAVVAAVAELDPSVHRASVYRTLEALSDLGVVQHLHVGHGGTAYHLVRDSEPHVHVQCRSCAAVLDAPADLLDQVAGRLSRQHGFILDSAHVALSGVCSRCHSAGRH